VRRHWNRTPSHCYRTLHLAFHRATRLSSLLPIKAMPRPSASSWLRVQHVNAKGPVSLHHEFRVSTVAAGIGHASWYDSQRGLTGARLV